MMTFRARSNNFIAWWAKGLACLVPASLRRLFQSVPEQVTIEFQDQKVLFRHYPDGASDPVAEQTFMLDEHLQQATVARWVSEHNDNQTEILLLVPEQLVLRKDMVLPAAARTNMRQVLGFEMERKTPFTPDQTFFDFTVAGHDKNTKKLHAGLVMVPRKHLDPLLDRIRSWGITLDVIRPVQDHNAGVKTNLLQLDNIPAGNNGTSKLTLLLAYVAVILLFAALYIPLNGYDQHINKLEQEIDNKRKAAVELNNLKKERDSLLEQINFLALKRANKISSIELMNEITRIIPDDTWLTRLVIKDDEVQLQGESDNASTLIQIIESSDFFSDVEFKSPLTQNNATKKEKFFLSAKYTSGKQP